MKIEVLTGTANRPLAEAVARELGVALTPCEIEPFPDGELHVAIQESVRDADIYLIQPTGPPVDRHLQELLFLADACRHAGAARITAVVPYFGYARQDRRASGREPVSARLVADLMQIAGVKRVVAVDLHSEAIESCFASPLEHLSAVPTLAAAAGADLPKDAVIVAPDLGAAKLADHYARLLELPVAIVHKTRLSAEEVSVRRITGEVHNRVPVVVDDMISTGGTVCAALEGVRAAGSRPDAMVVVTHALLVGPAVERLNALSLGR
jgi:ribose-phosphate pyrophosphokinase